MPPVTDSNTKNTYVDFHCHFIHNIDDGPSSIDKSLEILNGLNKLGFVKVAATPHFDTENSNFIKTVKNRINEIENARKTPLPEIYYGSEIIFGDNFALKMETGCIPVTGSGKTFLIEFGTYPGSVFAIAEKLAFKITVKGIDLVLAHPERCADFIKNPGRVSALKKTGVFIQLDLLSLAGKHGSISQDAAYEMLEMGLYELAASDIHSPEDLPHLENAIGKLKKASPLEFEKLLCTNPEMLLDNRAMEIVRE